MHFYCLGYQGTLALPLVTFWFLANTIDRIEAQDDLRHLAVAASSQAGRAAQSCQERLVLEVGTVVKMKRDPMRAFRDERGVAKLKELANRLSPVKAGAKTGAK
jgi:hypothetical protein